jgi:hypothetical protein
MNALRWITIAALVVAGSASAQDTAVEEEKQKKERPSLRDPLDGKFDMSEAIIEAGAFVPVPILITEPALGGFGGGIVPVFIEKKPLREINGEPVLDRPDVTAGMFAYTLNGTWFVGGARVANIPKWGLHYTVGGGYGNINLDFYERRPSGDDKAYAFTAKVGGATLNVKKEIFDPRFLVGLHYGLGSFTGKLAEGTDLPSFATEASLEGTVSTLGPIVEWDGRDGIFSTDRGMKIHTHYFASAHWLGSDFDYGKANAYVYGYVPVLRNADTGRGWVSAVRADWQQATGDPPFFLLPYVDMRGIPLVRYQGRTTLILETEQRFDVTRRWSAMAILGLAEAFDRYDEIADTDLIYTYGTGFRYLMARQFKLRMGIDVAKGPETWGYYIVFGSAWRR